MTTGQKIREARKKAGITQQQLAEKIGIPYQSVSRWERDEGQPKYESVRRIANALRISPTAILPTDNYWIDESGVEQTSGADGSQPQAPAKNQPPNKRLPLSLEMRWQNALNSVNLKAMEKLVEYAELLATHPLYQEKNEKPDA